MRANLSSYIKQDQVSKRYYRPASELELASLSRFEKVPTTVSETDSEGARLAALETVEVIERCIHERGRCVIGLGAGKGVLKVYDELVNLYFADKISFSNVIAFNISELGLGVVTSDTQSTMDRLQRRLFSKVDFEPENIRSFSNDATKDNVHRLCKQYEAEIASIGGLDLVICELTKNSSMAFNEPGSTMNSSCRLMLLGNESRTRIADSYQCEVAPSTAVTLGIANFLAAREMLLVAWGEESADAVFNTVEGRMNDGMPSSFMQMHHNVKLITDLSAASHLTRINTPWKVSSCDWNDLLITRAIIWLSMLCNKPILKLTNKDYNSMGLSELVALYGSAYNVNIKVFNQLQRAITGWPGGKPNADDTYRPERAWPFPKRVLIFSPHPDDAVVAMGGTIKRLTDQGHDVHMAMQTNGDTAVTDEDMDRTVLLIDRLGDYFNVSNSEYHQRNAEMRKAVGKKKIGDPDTNDVRFLKGTIFFSEAVKALGHLGVPQENLHELNMPFFTEHPTGRGRITEKDVKIVIDLIKEIQPHQIFFDATLNDPYGVHAPSADAVLEALEILKDEPFMQQCRVWMYRGAYSVWDIDDVEMAVPMSPEEFAHKRDSILRYQSQMGDAPFRNDEEDTETLSWMRTTQHNKNMADSFAKLGLATYEAMEVFVQHRLKKED